MPFRRRPPVLVVGTDCSGLETPLRALAALGIGFTHAFASDMNQQCHLQAKASGYSPQIFYKDLLTRDNANAPQVDVYVAGWPCQPNSTAGTRRGKADPRSDVFLGCARYIDQRNPKVYVLENVPGLLTVGRGEMWNHVMKTLRDCGDIGYYIHSSILNTEDHGVPQHRKRLYIVGIRSDVLCAPFTWPEALPAVSLHSVLDDAELDEVQRSLSRTCQRNVNRETARLKRQGGKPSQHSFVIDIDSSANWCSVMLDRSPCVTRSRPYGFWLTDRCRRMTQREMLKLQGMAPLAKNLANEKVVSDRQLGMMIGNAMSQNVLERLFVQILKSAFGVSVRDPWPNYVQNMASRRDVGHINAAKRRRLR